MPVYFNGPNKFPVPCPLCRKIVPVGLAVNLTRGADGRWQGFHKECLDKKNAAADIDLAKQTRVDIELEDDGRVAVRFTGPGSRTAFSAILSSHGYFWDRDAGQSFGSFEALPALVDEIKGRYDVHISQTLQERIEFRLEQALGDQAEAAKRATDIDEILKKKDAKLSLYDFQKKSIQWLAPRRKALLGHPMGLGKAQPLDAQILTPQGWKEMGCIAVGDEVIGSDGRGKKVLGVFPQGERDIYRVVFSDGSKVECDKEHLWTVERRYYTFREGYVGRRSETHTLGAIIDYGLKDNPPGNARKNMVRVVAPVQFESRGELPIPPYLVGLLLGDGGMSHHASVYLTTADDEILESAGTMVPEGVSLVKNSKYTYRFTGNRGEFTRMISDIGLSGTDSFTKFIPEVYRFASVEDRISLLQGLIDTDGYVMPGSGNVFYYTVSDQLAEDVVFLVKSLGGVVKRSVKIPTYKYKGEKKTGAPCHVLGIGVPNDILPCRLARKRSLLKPRTKYPVARYMDRVEYVGKKQAQCILIDAPDHLYVTNDFVLTHNTVIAAAALAANIPVLIVCPLNAVGVWMGEMCRWRPDYAACRTRTRAGFTFLEPERGIKLLEGKGSFAWPKPGEVAIMTYAVLPLTPSEWEEAQAIVSEWEAKGQPESFTWRPPWFEEDGKDSKGVEVDAEEIEAARRLLDSKARPITAPPPGVQVIFDEAQTIKFRAGQKQSNRAKRFMALAEYVRANDGRTWGLSGTPLLNEPTELWAVLRACGLANEIFGTRKTFDAMFQKKGKGWEPKSKETLVRKLQRGMLRFSKTQALKELPPKTREHVDVDISPEDSAKLDALLADVERLGREKFAALAEREQEAAAKADAKRKKREDEAKKRRKKKREEDEDLDEEADDEEELSDADKLRRTQEIAKQAEADGYVEFTELSRVRAAVAKAKTPALFRVVNERAKTGQQLVVFSDHKEPVEFLADKFGGESGGWGLITGDTSAAKRAALADAFQRGKLVGIAATIIAAGTAITLTKSHRAIFNDENWVPANNRQAQDRIWRIGQFDPVTIEVLVAKHPIDQMIAAANERKIRLEEETIDAAALDIDAQVVTVADEFAEVQRTVVDIVDQRAEDMEDAFEEAVASQFESHGADADDAAAQYEEAVAPKRPTPGGGATLPPIPPAIATSAGPKTSGMRTGDVYEPSRRPEEVVLPPVRDPRRMAPTTPEQVKAAGIILALLERGGFRPGDTFTPSLAQQLATTGGLTERQWPGALSNADRYARGAPVGPPSSLKRQASSDLERWAAAAMQQLAGSDSDRARERNDVGFSKFDNDSGHRLAQAVAAGAGLSEGDWAHAVRLAHRYRRQVGSPPASAQMPQQNPGKPPHEDDCWHVVVSEGQRGRAETGVIGPDDVTVKLRGDVPERLLLPKIAYTPEEAAAWADAHGIPVKRVEG